MPIQSQPTADGSRTESLHSWSSQARPATAKLSSFDVQRAARGELRLAVVVAGLLGPWPLARHARVALQQHRLRRVEHEIDGEAAALARCLRDVAAGAGRIGARQSPVADHDVGVADARLGDAEAGAGDALVVAQAPGGEVAHRGVREQQLPRGEAARLRGAETRSAPGRT